MSAPAPVPRSPEMLCTLLFLDMAFNTVKSGSIFTFRSPSRQCVAKDLLIERQSYPHVLRQVESHLNTVVRVGIPTTLFVDVESDTTATMADRLSMYVRFKFRGAIPVVSCLRLNPRLPVAAQNMALLLKSPVELGAWYSGIKRAAFKLIHRRALQRRARKNRLQAVISEHWPSQYYFVGVATLVADYLDSWPVTSRLL